GRGVKLAVFVPEPISEGVGMVIPAGGLLVRAKEALTGIEANVCRPEEAAKAGGTLMLALASRFPSPVIPVLSVFCRQNQTPTARAKAAKIQGNRPVRLRFAR